METAALTHSQVPRQMGAHAHTCSHALTHTLSRSLSLTPHMLTHVHTHIHTCSQDGSSRQGPRDVPGGGRSCFAAVASTLRGKGWSEVTQPVRPHESEAADAPSLGPGRMAHFPCCPLGLCSPPGQAGSSAGWGLMAGGGMVCPCCGPFPGTPPQGLAAPACTWNASSWAGGASLPRSRPRPE